MIELSGVTKSYPAPGATRGFGRPLLWRSRRVVLDRIDLVIPAGGAVALVGENGAGKTTLLRVLAGLAPPEAGRIFVAGVDLAARPERLRRLSGFAVADDRSFFGSLSAAENLRFFASLGGASGAALRARVERGLDEVGLAPLAGRPYRLLSSGERQRLAIARALLDRPPLLLLDEPTRSLDPRSAEQVLALVAALRGGEEGRTIVLATHSREEAARLGAAVVELRAGALVPARVELSAPSGRPRYRLRTVPEVAAEELARAEGVLAATREGDAMQIELAGAEALDALIDHLRARGVRIRELSSRGEGTIRHCGGAR